MSRFLIYAAIAVPVLAQEHIAVPLADPSRPVTMSIHLNRGGVTIRGSSGREVIVDSKSAQENNANETTRDGLHRISGSGKDVTIESENNKVSISSNGFRSGELTIQTPLNTSLNVKTLTGGAISIEGVTGDIEAQNLNGGINIRNVSGSVVAHSLHGLVTVALTGVKSGSPMSFSSLNGNIDVTLPANLAADFSMKTNHGEIYSDFDVKLKTPAK